MAKSELLLLSIMREVSILLDLERDQNPKGANIHAFIHSFIFTHYIYETGSPIALVGINSLHNPDRMALSS